MAALVGDYAASVGSDAQGKVVIVEVVVCPALHQKYSLTARVNKFVAGSRRGSTVEVFSDIEPARKNGDRGVAAETAAAGGTNELAFTIIDECVAAVGHHELGDLGAHAANRPDEAIAGTVSFDRGVYGGGGVGFWRWGPPGGCRG